MRGKKAICAVVLLTLLFSFCGCGEKKSLADHGMDVVELIEEAINSEEYVMIYSASEQITRVIEEVAKGDFSELEAVYSIRIDEDDLLEMADVNLDDMPEALQKVMKSKMVGSVANMINARSGSEKLATSSIISMGKTFAYKEEVENQIYLYIFEDAMPIMVSFVAGEEGTVSAGGTVIFADDFECDSADDVEDLLRGYDVDVEEVDF